jgi:hypothetical protein
MSKQPIKRDKPVSRQPVAAGKTATLDPSAPPFRPPRNASDRQKSQWKEQMRLWLHDQIERRLLQILNDTDNAQPWEEYCIGEARRGNPGPLRSLYPHFADCIFSPRLRKGQRYPKKSKFHAVAFAIGCTQHIRAIWREQYGKQNRVREERQAGISAEAFAVDIYKSPGVTVDAVLAAQKPSGKHKPGSRNTRQKAQVAR